MSKDIQYIPLMTKAEVRIYSLIRKVVFVAGCIAVFTICTAVIAYCIYLMGWWCIPGGLAVYLLHRGHKHLWKERRRNGFKS